MLGLQERGLRLQDIAPQLVKLSRVPRREIASCLGVPPGYINTLLSRERRRPKKPPEIANHLLTEDIHSLSHVHVARALGIRARVEHAELNRKQASSLESRRIRALECFHQHLTDRTFIAGGQELSGFNLGFPNNSEFVRLRAETQEKAAWLYLHGGYGRAAIKCASSAILLTRFAASDRGRQLDRATIARNALIAAHGFIVLDMMESARRFLEVAKEALEGAPPAAKTDYDRELSIWFLCTGQKRQAKAHFERAFKSLPPLKSELRKRHLNLIHADIAQAEETFDSIRNLCGDSSLEYSVNAHWAAGCHLLSDSPTDIARATEILTEASSTAENFPDQAILNWLLLLGCDLTFSPGHRQSWITHVLYHHALPRK